MNKIFLYLLLITCLSNISFSQQQVVDSLQMRIESLEKLLSDKNYSRVPNVDLDKNLDYIVTEKIQSKMLFLMSAIGGILAIFGFSFIKSTKSSIKKESEEAIDTKIEVINNKISNANDKVELSIEKKYNDFDRRIERFINTMGGEVNLLNSRVEVSSNLVDKKIEDLKSQLLEESKKQNEILKSFREQLDSSMKNQLNTFKEGMYTDFNNKINESLKILWNDIAENKINVADSMQNQGIELIKDTEDFLNNENFIVDKNKKLRLIDSLMKSYYHTLKGPESREGYAKMIKLLKRYENEFELLPQTYLHAAIALTDEYEMHGLQEDFDTCIECCNKSISILKDYGTAYAIKLEVLMMRLQKAHFDKDREITSESIRKTFSDIENNKSSLLCIEIMQRFEVDRPVGYLKTYIELLEKLYPVDFQNIRERACRDIIQNNNLLKNSYYSNVAFDIMKNNPKIDSKLSGKWNAVKVIESGIETPTEKIDLQLYFEQYTYELKSLLNGDNGYFLILSYKNKIGGIDFFQMKDEHDLQTFIPAIYKFEKDQLILCSNYFSADRPEHFDSTAENKYYLEVYERVS